MPSATAVPNSFRIHLEGDVVATVLSKVKKARLVDSTQDVYVQS